MEAPLGRCYWAVAPFSPRPPFRLYAGEGATTKDVAAPAPMVDAARQGMSEFVILTPVKVRPVLVVTSVLPENEEVVALRLRRLEKIDDDAAQDAVRAHADVGLFWLRPDAFPGLPTENAAIVSSLLRLPVAAVDTRRELGQLNDTELRAVHERIARVHGLRLDGLVLERARRLAEVARRRRE